MALAAEHNNEFSLDDYHHHVQTTLGCGINAAVREMARRIATDERVLLICREYDADGNLKGETAVDRRDFSVNYDLKFDMSGRLRVVPRTLKSLFGGIGLNSSADGVVRRISLPKWHDDFVYTVDELPLQASQQPLKPKAWLPLEHERRKQQNNIPKITKYAQELNAEAVKAVRQGRLTNAPSARRFENLLHELSLFPKTKRRSKHARKTHD
jgi:hypothetical protein